MSTAAQDFITETKYDGTANYIWLFKGKDFVDRLELIHSIPDCVGEFIAAAISEKIEREKGEREEPECEHLYDKVENGELKYWECRFCKHTIEFQK